MSKKERHHCGNDFLFKKLQLEGRSSHLELPRGDRSLKIMQLELAPPRLAAALLGTVMTRTSHVIAQATIPRTASPNKRKEGSGGRVREKEREDERKKRRECGSTEMCPQ